MIFGITTSFLKGIFTLSFAWILIAMANVYFFIVIYSLYQILMADDCEQVKSHLTAATQGYQQCYESHEDQENFEEKSGGYKTSEFNEP